MTHQENLFFELLRFSLGIDPAFSSVPTAEEWGYIYQQASRQSLLGVLFAGANRLRGNQEPPFEMMMRWASKAEDIKVLNQLLNKESRRFTELFEAEGHHTAILKGQANALLYPEPLLRQPGDIDIFVDGGKEKVGETIQRVGLAEEPKYWEHHFMLPETESGVEVEVHVRPDYGGDDPTYRERLMGELYAQFEKGTTTSPQGFRVPSIGFALAMQLSHIQKHIIYEAIGMRQLVDYYLLLTHSSQEERTHLAERLNSFGLQYTAAGLMWIFRETLHLPSEQMIAKPDRPRGAYLLQKALTEGNFGQYKTDQKEHGTLGYYLQRARKIYENGRMFPHLIIGDLKRKFIAHLSK